MRKHGTRTLAGLSLALLLLCACASADTAFTYRSGITWDTTPSQMMAAEGVRIWDANVHQNTITDRFTRYYILDKTDGTEDVYFVYQGDEPVMMYTIPPHDTAGVSVYAHLAEEYAARFGTPIDYATEDLYALLHVIWAERPTLEDYERVTAWRLADGTLAALITMGGGNVMAYVNEGRLLASAESTAD